MILPNQPSFFIKAKNKTYFRCKRRIPALCLPVCRANRAQRTELIIFLEDNPTRKIYKENTRLANSGESVHFLRSQFTFINEFECETALQLCSKYMPNLVFSHRRHLRTCSRARKFYFYAYIPLQQLLFIHACTRNLAENR